MADKQKSSGMDGARDAERRVTIRFLPNGPAVHVAAGTLILDAAAEAGVFIDASCGGAGVCGRCAVAVDGPVVEDETAHELDADERARGLRLACACRVAGDVTVSVPGGDGKVPDRPSVRITPEERRLDAIIRGGRPDPVVRKFHITVDPPSSVDRAGDLDRLLRTLKRETRLTGVTVDPVLLPKLPAILRQGGFDVTATLILARERAADGGTVRGGLCRTELINLEVRDQAARNYALAVDVGTTTVWGQLVDLGTGEVAGTEAEYNGQAFAGADVISRMVHAEKQGSPAELQRAVVETINTVLDLLLASTGIDRRSISQITAAGNTVMTHLLLGLETMHVRRSPYIPVAMLAPPVRAARLGLDVPEHVRVWTFPSVSSWVGGDVVAGVMAAGLARRAGISLYVDMGTNGEVVVGSMDFMLTASCSAGPAFEGSGIECGTRVRPGAIEEFRIDPATLEPMVRTVGRRPAVGVCGSGIISAMASMFSAGVVDAGGKFNPNMGGGRIRVRGDGIVEYVLVKAAHAADGRDIVLTEPDIYNIMCAKAAMYAGMKTLLGKADLTFGQVDEVLIAGGFGSSIDVESAIGIGLLPDLPRERFRFVGNGSLLGARLSAISQAAQAEAERIGTTMTSLELSETPEFMGEYVASLFLPHTNRGEFPSVPRDRPGSGA